MHDMDVSDVRGQASEVSSSATEAPPAPPRSPIAETDVLERTSSPARSNGTPSGSQPLVLVVDDDPAVLRLVRVELSEQGFQVVTAATGKEALSATYDRRPDLIILDLLLPDLSGFEVMRDLREWSAIPVVLLTAKGSDADKVRGLELGADDYLPKPFNPDELAARVRAVLRRSVSAATTSGVVRAKDVEVDFNSRVVRRNGDVVHLTRTEWRLLEALAQQPGKVLSSIELLSRVWGPQYRDDVQYLRVWVSRIRGKLDPSREEPELIQTFHGIGYMLNLAEPQN